MTFTRHFSSIYFIMSKSFKLILFFIIVNSSFTSRADANPIPERLGEPASADVDLLIPVSELVADTEGHLKPGMRQWLEYVAKTADIELVIMPASVERWVAELKGTSNSCALGMARLPERETSARWISVVRYDNPVIIASADDRIDGGLEVVMRAADNDIAAPSGLYRSILNNHGIRHSGVVDHRLVARMVNNGRVRFGILPRGVLLTPEVMSMKLRIVAEYPPIPFWLACSPMMPDSVALPLQAALHDERAQALHKADLGDAIPPIPNPTTTPKTSDR